MGQQRALIIDAIQNKLRITFRYRSGDEEEATVREVDPWVYGNRNDKECLYGYQVSGGTGQAIRRFNMERVKHVTLTGDVAEHRPDEAQDVTKWNEIYAEWADAKAA
jgi:predicted DNA-binding transcriptional regulator YafY